MAFHESFWVAIATTDPIIALANTVLITDNVNVWLDSKARQRYRSSEALNAKARQRYRSSRSWYYAIVLLSLANFIQQAVWFPVALGSLINQEDIAENIGTGIATFGASTGLFYIFLIVFMGVRLKYSLKRQEEAFAKS